MEHWGNTVAVIHGKSTIFCKITAQIRSNSAAKLHCFPADLRQEGSGDFIIRIDNSAADTTLMQIDVAFCIDIFLHILVDIQMVWRNVGDNRNVWGFSHGNQLEAGQLHNSAVIWTNLFNPWKEWEADISA